MSVSRELPSATTMFSMDALAASVLAAAVVLNAAAADDTAVADGFVFPAINQGTISTIMQHSLPTLCPTFMKIRGILKVV